MGLGLAFLPGFLPCLRWRWLGSLDVTYSRLGLHAPAKSSEARGVHFLLALGLGLALGQYLSSPSCTASWRARKGVSLHCHLDSMMCWVNSSFLSLLRTW